MDKKNDASPSGPDRASRSLDYLRKRSLHRIWWSSANVALRRGRSGKPLNPPNGPGGLGKRV